MQKYLEQYGIDQKYIEIKNFFDRIFSFIIFIFLIPFFALISFLILLLIKENPFYSSYRSGLNNKKFKLYKFKSMKTSTSLVNRSVTLKNEKRIYPFGKFLRMTKIDELPQLINIIKGEMSFIGPRPENMYTVKNFYNKIELKTLLIRPGLASPGSIFNYIYIDARLKSEDEYFKKYLPIKLSLELLYLKKMSFSYDLKFILRTIIIILFFKYFKNNPDKVIEYKYVKNKL